MAVEAYHFWSSVCSVRCRMALEEKGVPWTSRETADCEQRLPGPCGVRRDGRVRIVQTQGTVALFSFSRVLITPTLCAVLGGACICAAYVFAMLAINRRP
jgi:hypothetical protein